MRFHGGTMDEPLGRRASFADWTFVACIGELEGRPPSSHGLAQHLASGTVPAVLRRAIAEKYDAAWVRARLPRVFGYSVENAETEKALLFETFVAVRGEAAFVFQACDYYGRTDLTFADSVDEDTKNAIATAFWGLLLAEPNDLEDFAARVYHPGAGCWLEFACDRGEVSLRETEE